MARYARPPSIPVSTRTRESLRGNSSASTGPRPTTEQGEGTADKTHHALICVLPAFVNDEVECAEHPPFLHISPVDKCTVIRSERHEDPGERGEDPREEQREDEARAHDTKGAENRREEERESLKPRPVCGRELEDREGRAQESAAAPCARRLGLEGMKSAGLAVFWTRGGGLIRIGLNNGGIGEEGSHWSRTGECWDAIFWEELGNRKSTKSNVTSDMMFSIHIGTYQSMWNKADRNSWHARREASHQIHYPPELFHHSSTSGVAARESIRRVPPGISQDSFLVDVETMLGPIALPVPAVPELFGNRG
ncbi:hypothetical protein DFH09DRAFT_1415699 [Mycena vulgaris]|nr:hypothetical protein DFH09DRAFT_1415699 [Mycena vulgaris]